LVRGTVYQACKDEMWETYSSWASSWFAAFRLVRKRVKANLLLEMNCLTRSTCSSFLV
jgi:hypothetical protein